MHANLVVNLSQLQNNTKKHEAVCRVQTKYLSCFVGWEVVKTTVFNGICSCQKILREQKILAFQTSKTTMGLLSIELSKDCD